LRLLLLLLLRDDCNATLHSRQRRLLVHAIKNII
jgi:hypothetical protein